MENKLEDKKGQVLELSEVKMIIKGVINLNSLREKFKYLYTIIFFISIVIIVFFLKETGDISLPIDDNELVTYESGWKYSLDSGEERDITIPIKDKNAKIVSINHSIDKDTIDNKYLFFKCRNREIKVYIDNEEIYNSGEVIGIFPFSKAGWHIVELKEEYLGKNLSIEDDLYRSNSLYEIDKINLAKNKSAILYYVMLKELPSIAIGFVLLAASLILFFVWIFTRKLLKNNKVLYLSILLILVSIGFIINTEIVRMIIKNSDILNIISCEILILIPMAIILHYLGNGNNRLPKVIEIMPIINFIICNLFYISGAIELTSVIHITNIFILIECLIFSGQYIYRIFIKKEKDDTKANIGFIVMAFFILFDIIKCELLKSSEYYNISKIGILIYISTLAYDVIIEIMHLSLKVKQADIYKNLAFKDVLTNIFNRFAFEEKMKRINDESGKNCDILLIMIDINNLKFINDSKGHESGDKYIIDNVRFIEGKINKLGSLYRIGGDEFVIISSIKNLEKLKVIFSSMENEILHNNKKINFAFGFAYFDSNVDKSIYDTLKRADKNMYKNKSIIKKSLG